MELALLGAYIMLGTCPLSNTRDSLTQPFHNAGGDQGTERLSNSSKVTQLNPGKVGTWLRLDSQPPPSTLSGSACVLVPGLLEQRTTAWWLKTMRYTLSQFKHQKCKIQVWSGLCFLRRLQQGAPLCHSQLQGATSNPWLSWACGRLTWLSACVFTRPASGASVCL